jgi:hypothetical protein
MYINTFKRKWKIGNVNQISIVYKTICSLIKCQLDREHKLIFSFPIYIEDKKLLSLGKSSVRRLLTIWTNISICSNDKDVIDDEGSRTRFVDLSDDDDDLIKVFDEGTDGVKFS